MQLAHFETCKIFIWNTMNLEGFQPKVSGCPTKIFCSKDASSKSQVITKFHPDWWLAGIEQVD